ncbi:MAG: peptide chain release factor N(5)-glutamine methyltransferase [Candidatus Omnitrophica bacterium]|nr:peptide chain release factor N(5)-glutamine methyltransferase [Candidatus Omnitrophota bacterium]
MRFQLQKFLPNNRRYSTEILKAGSRFLKENGVEEPRRNAEILLSHLLKKPVHRIYADDERITRGILPAYSKLLGKRASHTPLQYITGKVDFYKYVFSVEKGVLIPRPETEILVEKAVSVYKEYFLPVRARILDIGSGCGNIAVSLAKEIKNCSIAATDISLKALKVSHCNALRHKVKSKIKFYKSDIFPPGKSRFHMIVSNPPYIPLADIAGLDEDVKREPLTALSGGRDGTSVIRKILGRADVFLHEKGFLLMEIGYNQADFIRSFKCGMKLTGIERDLAGIERVAVFRKTG